MLPVIDSEIEKVEIKTNPSKTYKLNETSISGFVDNIDAVKQAIYHIFMVERYAYVIYSKNYGIELNQYFGKGFDYLKMHIEGTIRDALTYDLRIIDVTVTDIKLEQKDTARIKFIAYTIYGDLQMEVNVVV